jgi:hypothetical protein
MNVAQLQQKIATGYAKSAQVLGLPNIVYRATSSLTPIAAGNALATLPASFNAEDMGYQKPQRFGNALWYCLIDGTQTHVGDYLVGAAGTFFIAAMQPLLPILAVKCNRAVRIARMPVQNGAGYVGYSGVVLGQEVDVLGTSGPLGSFVSGWPAAILIGGKSDKDSGLPSDVKQAGYEILLPASVPLTIVASDILQDDLGRNFAIAAAELTDMGWRILATEEHA